MERIKYNIELIKGYISHNVSIPFALYLLGRTEEKLERELERFSISMKEYNEYSSLITKLYEELIDCIYRGMIKMEKEFFEIIPILKEV